MKQILKKIILLLAVIVALASCTKNWEEMNTDPNEPSDAPSTNILAHSLRYVGDVFFDDWQGMNNFLSYGGQVSKIQYVDEARYQYRESVVNNAWTDYYNTLMDQKVIVRKAQAEGAVNMEAAAKTFMYMLFQMATDQWKNIPFSDALNGEEGTTNPAYDEQSAIYDGIIAGLAETADLFNQGGTDDLGSGDLLFHGDVGKWQRFCNSLRIRVAMRISMVDAAKAKGIVEGIMANQAAYPIMGSNDDNAFMFWPGAAPYKEPWMENSETRDDHGMCNVLIDKMKEMNDPRLPVYAHPAASDGEYRGVPPGARDDEFVLPEISRIGARFRDDAAGFTPFMRYSEVLFFLSEAANKGWSVGGTAQDYYEAGVAASLEENGLDQAAIDAYLAEDGVAWDGSMEKIWIQKWISIFKQGQEVWAEVRRTDTPVIPEASGSSYGTHDRQPFRYPYPTDEFNLNGANIAPNTTGIVDQFWGQQMWWDTRTGIQ